MVTFYDRYGMDYELLLEEVLKIGDRIICENDPKVIYRLKQSLKRLEKSAEQIASAWSNYIVKRGSESLNLNECGFHLTAFKPMTCQHCREALELNSIANYGRGLL